MGNAGPRVGGYADGARAVASGPRVGGYADGARAATSGPRINPDIFFLPHQAAGFQYSGVLEGALSTQTVGPQHSGILESIPTQTVGPQHSGILGPSLVLTVGSSFTHVLDVIPEVTAGSSFTHVLGAIPEVTAGAAFNHLLDDPFPTHAYGPSTGGSKALIPPSETFSGVSSGTVPLVSIPTFGGVSAEIASSPPVRNYWGVTGGATPPLPPSDYFGGGTGGVIRYDHLAPPSNLVATVIDAGCIELIWQDNNPGVLPPLHYELGTRIERSLSGVDDWEEIDTVGVNVVTYQDRFAVPLVIYDYRVIAFNSTEESFPSNVATVVTQLPPGLPTPPPPDTPEDPIRDSIEPDIVDFKSPGSYGVEEKN
jgi:hypothetical protein